MPGQPFYDLLRNEEAAWLDKHFSGARIFYPMGGGDKMLKRALIKGTGGRPAELYAHGLSLSQTFGHIDQHGSGFIKPHRLWSAIGAVGLVKVEHGYANFATSEVQSREDWTRWLQSQIRRRRVRWMVEELLRTPRGQIPDDIKFLCFQGKINMIFLARRIWDDGYKLRVRWLQPNWRDIPSSVLNDRGKAALMEIPLPLPDKRTALEIEAKRLSQQVATPFIRVDLYDTDPIICSELTKTPGTAWLFHWTQAAKRKKGDEFIREWRLALPRLRTRIESDPSIRMIHQVLAERHGTHDRTN